MKIQEIKSNQQSKYDEIIEYLKQDGGYWLANDIWNVNDKVFKDNNLNFEYKVTVKNIKLNYISNLRLKNEIKYFLIFSLRNKHFSLSRTLNEQQQAIKYLIEYIESHSINKNTFNDVGINSSKWKLFLISKGLKINKNHQVSNTTYRYICNGVSDFIKDFYDDREETEKDIWYSSNIKGAKIPASGQNHPMNNAINFNKIPIYYRKTIKKYFKTIITKKVGIIVVKF